MNIITIVCDTFRRDHLGGYGNDWIHTENLNDFASKSVVFDRAYCGSFPTGHMRHDLFTGTYTFAHTFRDWKLEDNELAIQDHIITYFGNDLQASYLLWPFRPEAKINRLPQPM